MGNCFLCESKAIINRQDSASRTIYNCPACGMFVVSDLAEADAQKKANEIAAFLVNRKLSSTNEIVLISFEKASHDKDYLQLTVNEITELFPESFSEQMDRALLNLNYLTSYAGEEVKVEDVRMSPVFCARKSNHDALSFIIKSMQKAGFVEIKFYGGSFFPCGVIVSARGWDRISELKKGNSERDILFAYTACGESERGDQFHKAVRKAARECGFTIQDSMDADAKVNFELITHVKSSKIIVCDLTEPACEAYYTAAFARAKNKLCILTCHESAKKKLRLDEQQMSILFWNSPETLHLQVLNAVRAQI